jgi:hypothetical protein
MKKMLSELASIMFMHLLIVLALGGIALFVWNKGMVALLPNMTGELGYLNALAIMTGIYLIDMFVKNYIKTVVRVKNQKKALLEFYIYKDLQNQKQKEEM